MTVSIKLDLVSGGHTELELTEPDQFPSSYFISMDHSGSTEFWQLVTKILAASNRSVSAFSAALRKLGLKRPHITDSAMRNLFQRSGYAFGVFWHMDPVLAALHLTANQVFMFVRDPRDVVVCSNQAIHDATGHVAANPPRQAPVADPDSTPIPMLDFVQSPEVDHIALRYRQYADFCRSHNNVTVFRYEDVLFSWRELVISLIEKLDLQISRESAFALADSSTTLAKSSLDTKQQDLPEKFPDSLDKAALAVLEEKFADSMAYFGYIPEATPSSAFLDHQPEFLRAISDRLSMVNAQCSQLASQTGGARASTGSLKKSARKTGEAALRPMNLAENDPTLVWRLVPNAAAELSVLGRRVVMEVDSTGCRLVVAQPQAGEKTLAAYGCSFTFGWAIPAEETFCSLLQSMFPTWRIENHGTGGYSGTQNLIQLQRDSRWGAAEYVTFCWIPDHMLRNVADPAWLRLMTQRRKVAPSEGAPAPQLTFPRAALDHDGELQLLPVRFPRRDLAGIDLKDFSPDSYYLDLVCFSLFKRAAEIVQENSGHFFVTTLRGQLSTHLQQMLDDAGIPVLDASVTGAEFTCLPDDPHPNALANRIYAEKIRDYLLQHGTS
jgi:hypothetical protein